MDLTAAERDRRWAQARAIMARHDVDVLVAFSDYGDQASLARYFTNFRSTYDPCAALLYREAGCDLVLTHAGGIPLARQLSWATDILPMALPPTGVGHNSGGRPTVGGQISTRLADRGVRRVGMLGAEYFPSGWRDLISAAIPGVEFVEVWNDVHRLRLVKSAEEQALVREACRISDLAWDAIPEFVRVGRKRYEVLADVEHLLRLNGCEDSFNLCLALPLLTNKLDRNPYSALPIESGAAYLIEVSPRFLGYYGQQTSIVCTGAVPADMRRVLSAIDRARDKGLALVKPGVDLAEVSAAMAAQLRASGYEPASPSIGHAIGLELEDWHIDGSSLILEEGMTFIFHPMAAGHPAVMRADTYLVTAGGVERLTTGAVAPMRVPAGRSRAPSSGAGAKRTQRTPAKARPKKKT